MSETHGTEEWRPVVGFEGSYEISNLGRVRSVERRVPWQGTLTTVRAKLIKPCDTGRGHKFVSFCRGGRKTRKNYYIHRMVLEAFVGPCPPGMECRHFPDRDRANNRLDNLQWGTRRQNMRDKDFHGTHLHGERSPNAKMSDAMVRKIVKLLRAGQLMQKEIAAKFGIDPGRVQAIASRKAWRRISEEFD